MHGLMTELFPLCRSITGDGVRESMNILKKRIPIDVCEVPSGYKAFDWTVPKEWVIRDAYVKNAKGEKVIDFAQSNLHVVGYSAPVKKVVSLSELKQRLHSLPDYPNWIPYQTSYYKEYWGFCVNHRKLLGLEEGQYEVVIDSELKDGHLTFGELLIPGQCEDEVLISTYVCHPSMCNDNLSGIVVTTAIAECLMKKKLRYSYRFLFVPETIGSIAWLALNQANTTRIKHGLVALCLGDPGNMTYKKSRRGDTTIDRAVAKVFADSGESYTMVDYSPTQSDERQYCSPGFDLPVGTLTRTPFAQFDEYHTSGDNLEFVRPEFLADSLSKYLSALYVVEHNHTYVSTNPFCEPQLGKRGLYPSLGSQKRKDKTVVAMKWVLNFSDGKHDLIEIADRSGLPFNLIKEASEVLFSHDLLEIARVPRTKTPETQGEERRS